MLKIYICNDKPQSLSTFKEYINRNFLFSDLDLKLDGISDDPILLLEYLKKDNLNNKYDMRLFFLTIEYNNKINGFQLATKIRKHDPRCFIVFITHRIESYLTFLYGVEALDYIIEDMDNQVEQRICQSINKAYRRYTNWISCEEKSISITLNGKTVYIPLNAIIYITSSDTIHKLKLYMSSGLIEFYSSFKELIVKLDNRFIKCHKSFIINIDQIKEIDHKQKTVTMTNNDVCFLSQGSYRELKNKLLL